MSVPQAQLVLPSLDGIAFPEARVRFGGGIEIDAATLEEYLGADPKIGDEIELVVRAVVSSKRFARGQRNQDGLTVASNVLTVGLKVETVAPA